MDASLPSPSGLNASDAMRNAGSNAVIGVAKTLELNPQMVMWDPTQADIGDPTDLAASDARTLYFDGSSWADFVVGEGILTEDQLDPSYGGAPDQFIEANGASNRASRRTRSISTRTALRGRTERRPTASSS